MAIGDKPNQNLFGTNYNAEDEERKKAELKVQDAMMGTGVPASAFTPAPSSNPANFFNFQDNYMQSRGTGGFEQEYLDNVVNVERFNTSMRNADNTLSAIENYSGLFGSPSSGSPNFGAIADQINMGTRANDITEFTNIENALVGGRKGGSSSYFGNQSFQENADQLLTNNPFISTGGAPAPNPVTFLPYADDVSAPRASALSVFTPGGEAKPNVDVNAITPEPEMISPSAVNTALNQEVPVGSPSQGPGYFERLREFSKSALNRDQGLFDVDRLGTAADNLLGSAMRNLTPAEDRRFANNEPFGKTFTDTFAITRPDGTKFYPDEVTTPGETTQAPSGASDLVATPSVTPPVERPTAGAQEQTSAVVSPFLQSPDTPSGLGGPLLRGFEMVNDAARGPNAPMGQDATRAALGGMTLNEYLNAPAGTPGVSGLSTDPQGRMITPSAQPPVDSAVSPAVEQPPVDALSSFEQDSLSRQQRIGGTGSFEGDSEAREARLRANERRPGESQADRDTRVAQSKTTSGQTGGLSFDDARRRAEGQLAARGVKNPSASQVNALARSIQAAEPERLAELETKRALDAIKLRDAEAKKDFKPQIVEIGDQKLIQLSPNYYQPVRPEPTAEEPFEPRVLEDGGFTYYEVAPNRFERQPSTKTGGAAGEVSSAIADAIAAGGGEVATPAPTADTPEVATGDEFTPQQELGIQKVMADNEITRGKAIEELRKAGKLK